MPAIDVKPIRLFTREQPVTKVELWNTFRRGNRFVARPTVQTRGEIGLNAPKFLRGRGYARLVSNEGIDYLVLTSAGEAWLVSGVHRYLELHPEKAAELEQPLAGYAAQRPARTTRFARQPTTVIRLKRSRP